LFHQGRYLITFVLENKDLLKRLQELGLNKVYFLKNREEFLKQNLNSEKVLYLELPDGLNFDLSYFLKFATEDSIGLFYQKNVGEDLFLLNQEFQLSKILKPGNFYHDGFIPAGAYLGTLSSLKNFFSGEYSSFKGIPLGKNKDYKDKKNFKSALFLDRDGIINVDLGYLYQTEKAVIYEGVVQLIKTANSKDMPVIVLTNQSGVAKGWYGENDVKSLHVFLQEKITELGGRIDGWFYSPFHPEEGLGEYKKQSILRKPEPGMALLSCEIFPIDFSKSFMVGDKLSDNLWIKGLNCINFQRDYDLSETKFPIFKSYKEILKFIFG
jgi:D-glycero-D-manno-heptose 1,7-bisphosphate phosphatase